jgi:hypothetical protein
VVVNRSYASGDSVIITGITDNLNSARSETYTCTASNDPNGDAPPWSSLVPFPVYPVDPILRVPFFFEFPVLAPL